VVVRYPPDAPNEARVDSFKGLWGDALLDILAGLKGLLEGFVPALIDLYLARASPPRSTGTGIGGARPTPSPRHRL